MQRSIRLGSALVVATTVLALGAGSASAQYAVGHRSFGIGTAAGIGYSRMDFQFPGIKANQMGYLLPTLEMKLFLSDTLSIDLSVPVVNIAASNALQDFFQVTGEIYLDFHPSAPSSSWELFAAPGFGVSYAAFSDDENNIEKDGYAFHIPVRVGVEINNARRNFSFFVALRPFFSLVHGGSGDNKAGGGGLVEIGFNAYTLKYRADRY